MYVAILMLFMQAFVVVTLTAIKQRQIRALEREIYTLRHQKMEKVYRLAAVGKATIGILHDIANPITFSILYIEQKHHKKFHEIQNALQLVSKLIEHTRAQLLNTSCTDAFAPSIEIERAIEFLQHKLNKNNVYCRVLGDKTLIVTGDRYKFYQCISNLISNSIDAYAGYDTPQPIVVSISRLTDSVQVCIKDYGCGVSTENKPHIFTPFFSTKNVNDGMGIGLAETKQFIEEDFHGNISFESHLGRGTIFTLVLPSSLPSQASYATLDA